MNFLNRSFHKILIFYLAVSLSQGQLWLTSLIVQVEQFSVLSVFRMECRKTEPTVFAVANWEIGECNKEAMRC